MSDVSPESASETCDEMTEMQPATETLTSESMTGIQSKWTKTKGATTVPIFTLKTGAVREFFCNFFDDHLIDHILFQTNLYAVQNEKSFDPVRSSELYAFFWVDCPAWLS